MAKKKEEQASQVKETEDSLVFQASRPLKAKEFDLLSNMIRKEQKKSGKKIVLMPYSAEFVEE